MYRIRIITTISFLKKVILTNVLDTIIREVDLFIIDSVGDPLDELRNFDSRILGRLAGKVIGVKDRIEEFMASGRFGVSGEYYYPEFAIGLNEEEYGNMKELISGCIFIDDLRSLKNQIHIRSRIKPDQWLADYLRKGNSKITNVVIEDPYLLAADLNRLKDILGTAKGRGMKYLELRYKTLKKRPERAWDGKPDHMLNITQYTDFKKVVNKVIGFEPIWAVDNQPGFHDRKIIIDGMVYLLGNSFSIQNEAYTFALGVDKITYALAHNSM